MYNLNLVWPQHRLTMDGALRFTASNVELNRHIKADSLIACRSQAAPMSFPCHAVPLRV